MSNCIAEVELPICIFCCQPWVFILHGPEFQFPRKESPPHSPWRINKITGTEIPVVVMDHCNRWMVPYFTLPPGMLFEWMWQKVNWNSLVDLYEAYAVSYSIHVVDFMSNESNWRRNTFYGFLTFIYIFCMPTHHPRITSPHIEIRRNVVCMWAERIWQNPSSDYDIFY